MQLNETYGDHITSDAISRMYNVRIQVISSLGPQAGVNINQENGQHTMVLGHYAEEQGDHYVCLRSTSNFGCSEYEYNEPISDIDNIQTELDKHTGNMATYKLNLTNITVVWTTYKLNLTNVSLTLATHKVNSWAMWMTYKTNLTNIFLTTKVIGISFQTRYGSKLLGLYYNWAILKQIIYVSHLRL